MRKLFKRKRVASANVDQFLKKRGKVKLNVGCGTDYKRGWVNIDNNSDENIEKLDLNWDLRNPLPFPENSVDFIYNEHFFEHLTPDEGRVVMQDLLRVLKPGGVMRIAMPDLEALVHQYLNVSIEDDPVLKRHNMEFIKTRAERMNISFRWWDHVWIYDFEELRRRLVDAGGKKNKVVRSRLNRSKHPELQNLETRDESLLIAEITK
jgi:predicted SAM-dependent methyltransferase